MGNRDSGNDDRLALIKTVAEGIRERRKHVRIKYPVVGRVGDLPLVEIASRSFVPINLSLGGVLLRSVDDFFVLGEVYPAKVVWEHGPLIFNQEAKVVRKFEDRLHFEFQKADVRSFTEFSKSFNSGIRGARTKPVRDAKAPTYLLEFWKGEEGEKILFQRAGKKETADIFFNDYRVTFSSDLGLLREEQNDKKEWRLQPAKQEFIDEIVIFLTNIEEPSSRINDLLGRIIERHYTKK